MKPLNLEDMSELQFNSELITKEELRREKRSVSNHNNHQTWDDTFERWMQRHLYKSTQSNAKSKGVVNTLSASALIEMWKLQDGKCALSGVDLVWGKDHLRKASVDQIHPQGGYTLENTWLVCYGLNLLKNKFSLTELLEIYPQAKEVALFKRVYEQVITNKPLTHNNSINVNNLEILF
jgi:hypothetical protein